MTVEQPPPSLKERSMNAMIWSGADLFMRQGVQFVVAVTLARLLTPEEFGTIALLYLFTGIASVFIDGGFSSALVQKQDVTHLDESTVFWINLAMGLLAALGLWALAPWIAEYFGYPILVPLTGVLAISLAINALGSIHLVLFSKRLDFKRPMMVSAATAIVSGSAAVLLAINDFGIWALAWQTLIASLVSSMLLWALSPWRPAFAFSLQSARSMFRFGSYLLLSGLLDITYNRIYSMLIGKLYGVRDLAFYNRADNTKQIPVEILSSTLSRVVFPVFSAVADDKAKLQRGMQIAVRGMMLINIPMMFGLMATSENLIDVLYGVKWLPVAPILQVLCLAGIFWPLHVINLNALKAQGHSDLFFKIEVIKKVFGAGALLLGSFYGVMGIAWSQVFYGFFGFIVNAYHTGRLLNFGAVKQIRSCLPLFAASFCMYITVNYTNTLFQSSLLELIIQVVIGVLMYPLICYLLGVNVFKEVNL